MINTEMYNELLDELHQESLEIEASALVSEDGLMVASHLKKSVNEDRMAAMSAAMLSVGNRIADDLLGGITDRVMVQSSVGYVIVSSVTADMLLTVVTDSEASLGMVFHHIKKFAQKLQSNYDTTSNQQRNLQ